MKAIRIPAPFRCEHVDVADCGSPGPGEVRLRVCQVGLCGSDLTTFRGLNPMVSYPRIPGHEIGAVIESVGEGVPARWRTGTRVLVSPYSECGKCSACRVGRPNACRDNQTLGVQRDGAFTEFVVIPHERLFTSRILTLEEMALVEPLTVGFHAVDRGAVQVGEWVAVLGCGAIGLGAIAGAATRGAKVIAVDVAEEKLELARACGAVQTVQVPRQDLHTCLQDFTAGEGPAVMIEAAGQPATFRACVEETAFAGRVVYIGYAKAPVEYETKYMVMKELDIRGSRNALPADFEAVIRFLEQRAFPVNRVVTRTVSMENAPEALLAWHENPGAVTKIHVKM